MLFRSFYCVETITAPCGVVIAWVKFDKSESPTNILNWLEKIFLLKNLDHTIFALIKLVECFGLLLPMEVGIDGRKQPTSLLTLIITSIIAPWTICAVNGVTLVH